MRLTTIIRGLFALLFLLLLAFPSFAQTPENPFEPGTTVDQVFNWFTVAYGAVITIFTYVQGAFFKKSGAVPKTAVRYVIIAVVAAALFLTMGWANALQIFIGFIGAALSYDKILSPLGLKTPTPTPAVAKPYREGL